MSEETRTARMSVEDVYEHTAGVCFKTGPPGTVGAETEWLVVDPRDQTAQVPADRLRGLVEAGGPLPGRSLITYEPGGQLELSSTPQPGIAQLSRTLAGDLAEIHTRLDGRYALRGYGVDPLRRPRMQTEEERYRCMSRYFDGHSRDAGYGGLGMMCTTASVQVCVDIGADSVDAAARWRLVHLLGPVLVAAFANSPLREGRPTGLKSTRQGIWNALDPARTSIPQGTDPAEAYARYALDAGVMMVREADGGWRPDPGITFGEWILKGGPRGGPTRADLDYHLSTLFPPIRPRGWLELRMIDALPGDYWQVAVAVVAALLDDPAAAALATEAAEPVGDRWRVAAVHGLGDRDLARAARRCFAAARPALSRLGAAELLPLFDDYYARYVERGRCPADDTLTGAAPASRTERGGSAMTSPLPADSRPTSRAATAIERAAPPAEAAGPPGEASATGVPSVGELAGDALKERIAAELTAARDRSAGLTLVVLDEAELIAQVSPLMSPLVWDLAHIGNYEEQWLLRSAAGRPALRPELDSLYDAFEHPRATRPTLPLLPPAEAAVYIDTVRARVLDSLTGVRLDGADPLTSGGFVYGMVVQHEHQHDETMLATHQLRAGTPALLDPVVRHPGAGADADLICARTEEALIGAGPFVMGTSDDPWVYDNERPAHVVDLPAFYLDVTPVTVEAYLTFVESGGYDDPRWWRSAGWEWRNSSGKRAPGFWFREGGQWLRRRFGQVEPLPLDEPVQHVCWYEADAYARWAGKRLPTEAEWEKAARWDPVTERSRRYPWGDRYLADRANLGHQALGPAPAGAYPDGASAYGVRQLLGDVWEWTSSDFHGYPGFRSFPYKEYSEVFFGPGYKVLRGGSWATDRNAARGTFRNWDYPVRRQIFTGFRCARSIA